LAEAVTVARELPGDAGVALIEVARGAFTDGLHLVALISLVGAIALAVFVLILLRSVPTPVVEVEPPFPPDRFLPADDPVAPGHWATPPVAWEAVGARVDDPDALEQARAAIAEMPEGLRQVIVLRDIEGRTPDDVRDALGLGPDDERAMLHQARGLVRAHLERYFEERGNDARP
ncbi:MAG: hypothetical protein ACRDG7_14285, partial [Candidatus Limnocylindria bacterium]